MDNDRNIFLQTDIDDFEKFSNKIDDEIQTGLMSFLPLTKCI